MISVSRAEGEPMELQCTAEWPPDSREAIQLGERFMSSRIFKRSARAFRAPRTARPRMLPPPEYPRIPNRDRVAKSPQMKHLKRLVQRNCRGGLLRAGMHVFIPLAPAPCLSVELSQALSPMRLESSGRHSVSSSASEMSAKSLWPHLDRDRIRTRSRYTRTELRPDIKMHWNACVA